MSERQTVAKFGKCVCNKACVGLYFSNNVLTGLDWKFFSLRGRSATVAISLKTFLMNGSCPSQCWHNLRYIFYVSSVKPWRAVRHHAIQHMSSQLQLLIFLWQTTSAAHCLKWRRVLTKFSKFILLSFSIQNFLSKLWGSSTFWEIHSVDLEKYFSTFCLMI